MRALRTLAGIVLVLLSGPALLTGGVCAAALSHRDADGGFTAVLAPIHSDGYAVVVPDLGAAARGFGIAAAFGSAGLRVSIRESGQPLVLALAPIADLQRYLSGVARTEVRSVGFAAGSQPVTLAPITGAALPAPPAQKSFWSAATSMQSVDWDRPAPGLVGLVLLRSDGRAGIDVTVAVARYPDWLTRATWALLLAGAAMFVGGLAVLFRMAEPVLVVEAHRMVEFADRIAERLGGIQPGRSLAVIRRTRGLDLTGEIVPVRAEPDEDGPPGPPRPGHWREWLRQHHPAPQPPPSWADEPTGESPYIHTAT